SPQRLEFATLNGCQVLILNKDDPSLPPAIEPGSTLREVVWGADSETNLTCTDPNGLAIRVRLSQKRKLDIKGVPSNTWDSARRVDAPTKVYERAHPVEVGHVVFFTDRLAEMEKFYCGRLGFHVSDRYPGRGLFLRGPETGGHHDLFLLQMNEQKHGLEHVAFTVRDLHDVFDRGLHISRCGRPTVPGPGRSARCSGCARRSIPTRKWARSPTWRTRRSTRRRCCSSGSRAARRASRRCGIRWARASIASPSPSASPPASR